ncbi:MAG: hypothetical protein LUE98_07800 [Tannerellaceae bacterium]|nr:hypothetical protein [Tannerellaceae bacterium]
MRTIEEIKESITADFMNQDTIAELYDFEVGDSFSKHFSRVSIINILFYIFASATWVIESMWEEYKIEVEERIEEILPHRPKWYRDKALYFMKDKELLPDSDKYDTTEMSEEEILSARVVKNAVAVENEDYSILTIKVKGENGALDKETMDSLSLYFATIKDAGVRIDLLSLPGDAFRCEVDVYYNPILSKETVTSACQDAIRKYVENLPFNGEYTNMALTDHLQGVEGVKIVHVVDVFTKPYNDSVETAVPLRCIPEAGYFEITEIRINMIAYG